MSIFKFKQFEVDQSGCAMKINTDGVLLAALAEGSDPLSILDIGAGTGVIAMMLAQRFEQAQVHAVEIDEVAASTAQRNFENSVFKERLEVSAIAIEQYNNTEQFDLIVSNPPYFVNDLKNAAEKKGLARHTDEVFFDQLVAKVADLLSEEGSFWFILPIKQAELLVEKAKAHHLFLLKQIHLHSDEQKPAFRRIVCLRRAEEEVKSEHFYIYESEKVYTQAYRELLRDFFLGY
jgi:tRNA1Val (adenine37-N6)-methyltransferase